MINLDETAVIRGIDKSNFAGLIENFPRQLEEGAQIARQVKLPSWKAATFSNVAAAGLGGSAIAAEIAESYLRYELKIPLQIVRHYVLPEYISQKTLFIASSYSGNTEETLSAYREAKKRKAKIIGISSGGQLKDLCQKDKKHFVNIPAGLPPRAALGYSLSVLLELLCRLKFIKTKNRELKNAAKFLTNLRKNYTPDVSLEQNQAKQLAHELYGKIPIIYAGEDYFYSVAIRWKQQICENAKVLCFCNVFPEFNHNELVGWGMIEQFKEKLVVLILKDRADHKRVTARMEIIKNILLQKGVPVIELPSSGQTLLERMMSLIHLGDWVSYYLALLNETDPTPVEVIDYLKKSLAEAK